MAILRSLPVALSTAPTRPAPARDVVRPQCRGCGYGAHLDLWHAARRGRDAAQLEVAKQVIVLSHGTLALEDLWASARSSIVSKGCTFGVHARTRTWMLTAGWLSAYVENVCALRVGIVEPRSMIFVITPPA
eukprot:7386631-Prymnesium_polylepis.1